MHGVPIFIMEGVSMLKPMSNTVMGGTARVKE